MESLFIYNENIINTLKIEVLDVISLISITSGILVIITNNPVVSVLFLIGLFSSISAYLMMLGVHFIGLSYLLVYVGAVSILFLFILMLINVRISELLSNTKNSIPLAILVAIAFNYSIYKVLPFNLSMSNAYIINVYKIYSGILFGNYSNFELKDINKISNEEVFFATSKVWDGNLIEVSHIAGIGNVMYTNYSIWLIITSIILLLAMIGVIVITVKNTRTV
jgi:NADH-ubiquinone oxidoreductase chain 6